ncbi:MAG: oligosaccharide flippase family protein, partial [Planctomycetota bacterium]
YLSKISLTMYGAWLATGSVVGQLTILDFGLMGVLTQQSAVAYGCGNHKEFGRLAGSGVATAFVLSIFIVIASVLLSSFIPGMVHVKGDDARVLAGAFITASCANAFLLISASAGGLLKSMQRTIVVNMNFLISGIIGIVVTIVLIYRGFGVYSIAIGLAVRAFLTMLSNIIYAGVIILIYQKIRIVFARIEAIRLWKLSMYEFVTKVSGVLLYQMEPFLIGVLLGPKMSAVYVLTLRAHMMVNALAGKFGDAIMPALAHLYGEGRMDRFKEVVFVAIRGQGFVAAVGMTGVVIFNHAFIKLWVPEEVFGGMVVTVLAAVYGFVFVSGGVIYNVLYSMGLIPKLCRIALLEGITKVGMQIPFIRFIGISGAPIAGLVSQQGVSVWWLILLLARQLNLSKRDLFGLGRGLFKLVFSVVLLGIFYKWLLPWPLTWGRLAGQAVIFVFLAIGIAYVLDKELFHFIIKRKKAILS